ncbi:MAG: type II secretion system F family protein [Actinomycetota bacterium]
MLTAVLLATGLVAGVHPGVIAIAAVAVYEPRLVLAGAVAWAVVAYVRRRASRPGADVEAAFFRALAAELRSGASLRTAISSAADRVPLIDLRETVRLAAAGLPMSSIADDIEERLPGNGRFAGVAFRLSDWSGARVADTFEDLADRASDAAELARERRASTAQAKMSALIVGVAPIAFTVLLFATGRGSGLVDRGAIGWAVLGVGATLEIVGLVLVAAMVRRAAA